MQAERPSITPIQPMKTSRILRKLFFLGFLGLSSGFQAGPGPGSKALVPENPPAKGPPTYRIAFYNVENLFDCLHDTGKNDHDFSPTGIKGWGNAKYTNKRNRIFKVVSALDSECPLLALGLAEVENARVLRELCSGTPLRYRRFGFVHFESPDPRGIDVALLYRQDLLQIDTAIAYPLRIPPDTVARTRDILYIRARLATKDTNAARILHLFVNHFPSKYGGAVETDAKRAVAARLLRSLMDSLHARDSQAFLLAMGDFNTEAQDPVLQTLHAPPYRNLMAEKSWDTRIGSHKFREEWSTIDHIILNRHALSCVHKGKAFLFERDFLLETDERYMGIKPFRSFYGSRHLGGYSDHLPVYIDLCF